MQGVNFIPSSSHDTSVDVLRRWIQYLNRCVASSEVEESPGGSVPFSLEPILVELERGRYTGPILPATLADLISRRRPSGGSVRAEPGIACIFGSLQTDDGRTVKTQK